MKKCQPDPIYFFWSEKRGIIVLLKMNINLQTGQRIERLELIA